jgi:putative component of membrane protein insertase Oxa1/YidC/SpoIIIJ protein YidD
MNLSRTLLLAAIRGYKRHLSPRKGFGCAYRVHLGACSCSTLGLRAVSRYGAWRGLGVLRLRLEQCRLVADEMRATPFVARPAQAGFVDCDLPCDGSCIDASWCSCGDLFSADSACEVASCASCDFDDCDWPWSRRQPGAPVGRRRRRGEPVVWEPGPDSPRDEA